MAWRSAEELVAYASEKFLVPISVVLVNSQMRLLKTDVEKGFHVNSSSTWFRGLRRRRLSCVPRERAFFLQPRRDNVLGFGSARWSS